MEGAGGVIVNHHPGANPAPANIHNMKVMQTYRQALNIPVGFTCHYVGNEILYMAVGMGANIIEKGFVEDPTKAEQDIVSAATFDEMADVIRRVNNCWEAIGEFPSRFQEPRDLSTRTGMVAKERVSRGAALSLDNVRFSFPPKGISSEKWDVVRGNTAVRELAPGDVINWNDISFEG